VAAGLDESVPDAKPDVLRGRYLNLFDPELAILNTVTIAPGDRMLLLNLNAIDRSKPKVVASACRVRDEHTEGGSLRFRADGIGDTNAVVAIATRVAPSEILAGGKPLPRSQYGFSQGVARVHFQNTVEPLAIEVRFAR
jgi:hypothetical protein